MCVCHHPLLACRVGWVTLVEWNDIMGLAMAAAAAPRPTARIRARLLIHPSLLVCLLHS